MAQTIQKGAAAAAVLQSIIQEIEQEFTMVLHKLNELDKDKKLTSVNANMLKLQFVIAVASIDARTIFDLWESPVSENIFEHHLQVLRSLNPNDNEFEAIKAASLAYIEQYNQSILTMQDPLMFVSRALMAAVDVSVVVPEGNEVPDSSFICCDYLAKCMGLFVGKWKIIKDRYVVV